MLERSAQILPDGCLNIAGYESDIAESEPLFSLLQYVPSRPYEMECNNTSLAPAYSFSNDESATYYRQTGVRQHSPEFLASPNRVALLVGEASLATALGHDLLPEDSIILLDNDPEHSAFMVRYVHALRTCETPDAWRTYMDIASDSEAFKELDPRLDERELAPYLKFDRLQSQTDEWQTAGMAHALRDPGTYQRARQQALKKAIVIWNADLAHLNDMRTLGQALERHNATVTFANMTNVLPYDDRFTDASQLADNLAELPFEPSAPILTTGFDRISSDDPYMDNFIVKATGPFFGLENLRNHGGVTNMLLTKSLGSAVKRRLASQPSKSLRSHPVTRILSALGYLDFEPDDLEDS